jgi:hypothetical protein
MTPKEQEFMIRMNPWNAYDSNIIYRQSQDDFNNASMITLPMKGMFKHSGDEVEIASSAPLLRNDNDTVTARRRSLSTKQSRLLHPLHSFAMTVQIASPKVRNDRLGLIRPFAMTGRVEFLRSSVVCSWLYRY